MGDICCSSGRGMCSMNLPLDVAGVFELVHELAVAVVVLGCRAGYVSSLCGEILVQEAVADEDCIRW